MFESLKKSPTPPPTALPAIFHSQKMLSTVFHENIPRTIKVLLLEFYILILVLNYKNKSRLNSIAQRNKINTHTLSQDTLMSKNNKIIRRNTKCSTWSINTYSSCNRVFSIFKSQEQSAHGDLQKDCPHSLKASKASQLPCPSLIPWKSGSDPLKKNSGKETHAYSRSLSLIQIPGQTSPQNGKYGKKVMKTSAKMAPT